MAPTWAGAGLFDSRGLDGEEGEELSETLSEVHVVFGGGAEPQDAQPGEDVRTGYSVVKQQLGQTLRRHTPHLWHLQPSQNQNSPTVKYSISS